MLQLVQALRAGDKEKRVEFSDAMLQDMEDDNLLPRLFFSDKATFHLSGDVNITIWAYADVFLWGYGKGFVFVPPLATNLNDVTIALYHH